MRLLTVSLYLHILIMDEKKEQFRLILKRYAKLGWMPREDLDWILKTLTELLENKQGE